MIALNLVAGKKNIRYILHHCKPKAIFANSEQSNNLKEILADTTLDCPIVELDENSSSARFFGGTDKKKNRMLILLKTLVPKILPY